MRKRQYHSRSDHFIVYIWNLKSNALGEYKFCSFRLTSSCLSKFFNCLRYDSIIKISLIPIFNFDPKHQSILGSLNENSIIDINVATTGTYSVACQNYLQYSSRIKDLWPGLVLLLLVLYPWGFSILCTSTYCIYTVHCLCVSVPKVQAPEFSG